MRTHGVMRAEPYKAQHMGLKNNFNFFQKAIDSTVTYDFIMVISNRLKEKNMNELIKIREMALRYDISARTLKYYEEMGLISSTRSDDYAYRMYDEIAVQRLEQILILRN